MVMQKILIVDDEAAVTDAMRRMLAGRYDVSTANNGEEALGVVDRNGPFSAVIADYSMPGMNGVELLSRLRQSEAAGSRMMLTGQGSRQVAVDSINRCGVSRFLSKPVAQKDLLAALAAVTDRTDAAFAAAGREAGLTASETSFLAGLDFGDALFPVFQPKVDLRNGTVVGLEALSRMRPERGLVATSRFCDFYERSPRALEFSTWILHEALAAATRMHVAGRSLQVAVNVPAAILESAQFVDAAVAALDHLRVPGALLQLEITERGMPIIDASLRRSVARLRECGVSLAVDDFGAGFDSLVTLKELGVEVLKLDGWFAQEVVTSERTRHIFRAVLDLADKLGSVVVAECIETQEQADILRALGCAIVQGYLFAPPLAEDALVEWLAGKQSL